METRGGALSRPPGSAGLCTSCANATVITSARGAVFYRCDLSFTDGRFPKYPRLPVLACPGYTPAEPAKA